MLKDFLNNCQCVDPLEIDDFRTVCREISDGEQFISYAPSICFDLWPMYVLQSTTAATYLQPYERQMVYLLPIGAHSFWAKPEFRQLVLDFYRDDEFPDNCNIYNFSLDEMILLQYPNATETLELEEFGNCNAVYLRLSRNGSTNTHVFILLEKPSECWKTVIEKYQIPLNVLVDSHKGLGNWFENIPLYSYMLATNEPELRPQFYFKGKYISHPAPKGFVLLLDVEESNVHECTSQIFRTPW